MKTHPVLVATESELKEYFGGKRTSFSVNLDPVGTEFQTKVWRALSEIPFGETRSYGEITETHRKAKCDAGGRCRQWPKSDLDRRSLPPGYRRQKYISRICWRPRHQGTASVAGNGRKCQSEKMAIALEEVNRP